MMDDMRAKNSYPDLHPLVQRTHRNYRTARIVSELLHRDGTLCSYCARPFSKRGVRPTIDHRVPLCRGGVDAPTNMVAACRTCNEAKSDMPEDGFRWAMAQLAASHVVICDSPSDVLILDTAGNGCNLGH